MQEHLTEAADLSLKRLHSCMRTKVLGQQIVCFERIDSTNLQADRLAKEGALHGTLVVADMQTAGRGRRGRSWQQEPGTMAAMSLILRPEIAPDEASVLTLVAAHSVALTLEKMTGVSAFIKWPNDIVINGKKAVGILTEMCLEQGKIGHIILGIGINAGTEVFPEELKETATSLYLETGKKPERCELIASVLEQFEKDYATFVKWHNLSGILESYNAHLINCGREVKILDTMGEYTGISKGVTETGELLVERADGRVEAVYAGEVSVRGLYGYV